eukprot:c54338_g1_i1 orf=103-315(-)
MAAASLPPTADPTGQCSGLQSRNTSAAQSLDLSLSPPIWVLAHFDVTFTGCGETSSELLSYESLAELPGW